MNVSLTPELEQLVTQLEALRRLIQEGFDSGPAAPLDMDEIIATARAERVRLDAMTGAAK